MKSLIIKQQANGRYDIIGHLTFATINNKTSIVLKPDDDATISLNFDHIETSDSAGLALIIEWLKSAHKRQITLRLKNLPEQILSLAKLSDVDTLLNAKTKT